MEVYTKIGYVIQHLDRKDKFYTGLRSLLKMWGDFHRAKVYDTNLEARNVATSTFFHGTAIIVRPVIINLEGGL